MTLDWRKGVLLVMLERRGASVRWRVAFGFVVVVSLIVLFAPEDDVPSGFPPGTDKVVHVLLFAALAATGTFAGARIAWLLPVLCLYAVCSELAQGMTALGRSSDPFDVGADLVGVFAGLALTRVAPALRRDGR